VISTGNRHGKDRFMKHEVSSTDAEILLDYLHACTWAPLNETDSELYGPYQIHQNSTRSLRVFCYNEALYVFMSTNKVHALYMDPSTTSAVVFCNVCYLDSQFSWKAKFHI